MEKEEILAKAQAEKKDEMEVFVSDKSMRWTCIAMVLAASFFAIVRSVQDQPIMDLTATVGISACVGNLYRYNKTKEKFCLVMAGIAAVIAVVSTVKFFMGH